ncbi:hypothetical protein D9Q98_004558 [Chlorella vulgaris]|uniref:Uncharacterized protein n=1 Tax=Chlorella vulgaris TaxID=3077 RepID=A0A9D4YXJ6_CHLVU|nr:hypothetical protein D9Q98_004558 [Chlorella vulgaris]
MQRQQLAAEQQEWQRQMNQRTGHSLPMPSPTPISSSHAPTNPTPEQGTYGANEAASGEGSWDCSSALPVGHLAWSTAAGSRAAAAAAFQLGGITDSEVRHHITALLLRGGCPNLGPLQPQAMTASPAAAARPAASPCAVEGQPSAVTASASGGALLDPYSAVATAGDDVGRGVRDPLLQAWLVTRTQPDLPIRGYTPPPSRAACRLVAAEEMIQFYRRQRKIQGCFFQHLRLTRRQAGRGASETDSVELLAAEEDPVVMRKRSSLGAASSRASINQATEGGPVPEIAAHSQRYLRRLAASNTLTEQQLAALLRTSSEATAPLHLLALAVVGAAPLAAGAARLWRQRSSSSRSKRDRSSGKMLKRYLVLLSSSRNESGDERHPKRCRSSG